MKRGWIAGLLLAVWSVEAHAQTLGEQLRDGLSQIGEGAQEIGRAVGQGATNLSNSVNETVTSTHELIEGEETPEAMRATLDAMADENLTRLLAENQEANALFAETQGYAVFDVRRVTAIGLTGGGGRGVAVAPDGSRIYMKMATGGVGLGLGFGGFESKIVIMFEDAATYQSFVTEGLDASAEAGTMVDRDRETLRAQFVDGRAYFYVSKRGWRIAASAVGTRYWRDAALN